MKALFDFHTEHTAQARELTNDVIAELVTAYGANKDWIAVGSIYYAVSGHLLSVFVDGKPLKTARQIAKEQHDLLIDVVLGLVEPQGQWAERNVKGREEVKYSEWR